MMLRFAVTLVLAMHAWSGVVPADDICAGIDRLTNPSAAEICRADEGDTYAFPGPDWQFDGGHGMTATKGDIDAINKRLDHIEELLRRP